MADLENEEWRSIPGFPGYEASSLGRIRSLDRVVKQKNRWGQVIERRQQGRILSPRITSAGYSRVNPCVNGRVTYAQLHRLVCAAFHGERVGLMAAHNDGNPSNNRPENLRWATAKENAQDKKLHGTDAGGTRNPNCVIGEAEVRLIRARADEPSPVLAREFGISESQVLNIIHGRSWSHLPGARPKPSCAMRKLTDAQRQEVIQSTLSGAELGRIYGVAKESIYGIRQRAARRTV